VWAAFLFLFSVFLWCLPELTLAGLVGLVFYYRHEVGGCASEFSREWLRRWFRRGIIIPWVLWALASAGRAPLLPPLVPFIGVVGNSGKPVIAWWLQIGIAGLALGSFWAAGSFIWFMSGLIRRAKNNDDLLISAIFWSPVAIPLVWGFCALFGWAGLGFAVLLWTWPLTQYCLNTAHFRDTLPMYSRAIGKIKFGKYAEAEMAIISELEKCETDFDGWMMLADLYAHQFRDLSEAEKTIYDLCSESTTTLSQVSIALHKLADWHLELRHNPAAARRVLEDLCARVPGTHLEAMARHRIRGLPASSEELIEQKNPRPIAMPALNESLGEPTEPSAPKLTSQEATAAANQCVEKLKADPNDVVSREKLARLFAEEMQRVDLAVEQMELLIGMDEPGPGKKAQWLAQVAAWQVKPGNNEERARETLERLISDYPQTPQAFAAQRRLGLIKAQARIRIKGPSIKSVPGANEKEVAG